MMDKIIALLSAIMLLIAVSLSVVCAMAAGVAVVLACYGIAFFFTLIR